MYKRLILLACLAATALSASAQHTRIDTTAVYILQHTSATLQAISACSFNTTVNYDVWSDELGLVKHSTSEGIAIKQPNKLRITSIGDKGHRKLQYNGTNVFYYSYDKNQYAEAAGSESVIQTIDTISKKYGIEFPAADFFYPTFVEDVINTGGNLIYLGVTELNGQKCFHIAGKDANTGFQFWIADDGFFLPLKIVMTYYSEKGSPQYEECYSNWVINPDLPDSMFEFSTPPKAGKVELSPKKNS